MTIIRTENYIGKRVAATLIDYTLIFALTIFYVVIAGESDIRGVYSVHGWAGWVPELFWFLYFVVAERYLGGTLGHLLFKIKVVSQRERQVSFGQIFLRRICDALEISWCFGLFVFFIQKNTKDNQRLGDLVAKTIVIGKYDELFPETFFDFENANELTP